MKKQNIKRLLNVALATMLCAASLIGCGEKPNENAVAKKAAEGSETAEENTDGYTVLKFLEIGSGLFEEEHSAVIKKIAEETGVFVQRYSVSEEKWNVLMASGDLDADIISAPTVYQQQLVEGGLLMPLDDLIEQCGEDIKKTAGNALDYWREYKSFGKNQLYFIPSHNAADLNEVLESVPYNYGVAPYIRWDYYEELGYPEVHNEDDFLNVLKMMQDAHPETEDGKKTYPISLSQGGYSAPLWAYFTMYNYWNGYEAVNNLTFRTMDNELCNVLEEDYIGWDAIKFYNKAYQMGIYDPESLTQKTENVTQKITTGQSFYTENSWNSFNQVLADTVGEDAGFEPLLEAFPYAYAGGTSSFGWAFTSSITSSCSNPEAAMKWLNYLYSEEGARLLYSGIEGIHWNYEDGVPTLTDETVSMYQDQEWSKENGLRQYLNMIGIDNMIKHSDGYPVDLFNADEMLIKNNKAIDTKYCEHYGVDYPGQVGKKLGIDLNWWIGDIGMLMPTMPDNMKRILTKAEDAMVKGIPKMILADTEEKFEEEKLELIAQLESVGAREVIDWTAEEFNKAKAEAEKLTK